MRVQPRLMREYLDRFGYKDVVIPGTFGSPDAAFPMPQGMGGAFAFPDYAAVVGALGKVESIYVRTIDEALGIPTEESHALTYESANWLLQRDQGTEYRVRDEGDRRGRENRGARDTGQWSTNSSRWATETSRSAACSGVDAGVIDSSFSPNKQVKDQVIGVKDCRGAIRWVEFGNLPFPEEVKEFHREKVAEREKAEGGKADYEMTVRDFWAFSKGQLVGKA